MKRETIIQGLLDFLGLSQNQLAEFFNMSRPYFTMAAHGTRQFPSEKNLRRIAMLTLMVRMKAEKTNQPEEKPIGFSPAFLKKRLRKVENRIRILKAQLEKLDARAKTRQNALQFYARMKEEFTDLTPLDLAWIQKESDKIIYRPLDVSSKEKMQWELKILQWEWKELNAERSGEMPIS